MLNRASSFRALTLIALLLVAMAGCGDDDDPIRPPTDTLAPTVAATNPLNGATGVAVITASFSEAMTASTITTSTFTVTGPGATPVAGTVAYNTTTRIATFTPTSPLTASTAYTATITTGAEDLSGNGLASNYTWSRPPRRRRSDVSRPQYGRSVRGFRGFHGHQHGRHRRDGRSWRESGNGCDWIPSGNGDGCGTRRRRHLGDGPGGSHHGVQRRGRTDGGAGDCRRESGRVDSAPGPLPDRRPRSRSPQAISRSTPGATRTPYSFSRWPRP